MSTWHADASYGIDSIWKEADQQISSGVGVESAEFQLGLTTF